MEKSLKFSGIIRVTPIEITLKTNAGFSGISLNDAVRKMMGIVAYEDVPCELVITANRCDDCFEINGKEVGEDVQGS